MKRLLAWGESVGGVMRAPRLYFAVVPLAVPLIFASLDSPRMAQQAETPRAALSPLPPIVYNAPPPVPEPLPTHPVYLPVKRGDTLDTIFQRGGLSAAESYALIQEFTRSVDPRRLRPGDLMRFEYNTAEEIETVSMKITGWGEVLARRVGDVFHVSAAEAPERRQEVVVSATIDSSLYAAIHQAGEQPQLVQALVDVFQWDVDFFRLQDGDAFSMVVEKKYSGDDMVGYGPVLAARFLHDGKLYEAFRFDNGDRAGYYTRNGTPVRKQFLRAPLKFTRITSGFTHRRFHPVLKVMRPHHGVDYGAPVGTPVMSTADGVVVFSGYESGEGNYIRIKHNSRMETWYLHLSRFRAGLRKGTRVEQGEVIGYVGSTGLSTAPHLDYRVRDAGKFLNPMQLKSITPDPLGGAQLGRFRASVASATEKLDSGTARLAQKPEKSPALF